MNITLEELLVKMKLNNQAYRREMKQATNITKRGTNDMGKMFRALKTGIIALGIGRVIRDSLSNAFEQTMAETKLTTIMQQRMNATDDQIKKIKELAKEEQKRGIYGDELILQGQQQLASFLQNTEALETLTGAMADLVAQSQDFTGTGGDFVNVANMMGRALQGNIGALTRVGISFSEEQGRILQTGTEMERAEVMAQVIELTNGFGGMNEALAQTPQGQWRQIQNELGDLQKELGYALMPVMMRLLPLVEKGVQQIRDMGQSIKRLAIWYSNLNPFLQNFIKGIGIAIVLFPIFAGVVWLAVKAKMAWIFVTQALTAKVAILNIALWKLMLVAGALYAVYRFLGNIMGVNTKTVDTGASVIGALGGASKSASDSVNDLSNSMAGLGKATKGSLSSFDQLTNLSDTSSGSGLIGNLMGDFDGDALLKEVQDALDGVKNEVEEEGFWEAFWRNLKGGWSIIGDWFAEGWNNVKTKWNEFWTKWKADWGVIKSWLSQTWNNFKVWVADTWDNIKIGWNNFWSNLATGWGDVKNWLSNSFSGLKGWVVKTWDNIKIGWNELWSRWGNGWDKIKEWFSTTWSGLGDTIKNQWGKIKTGWHNFWNRWRDGWNVINNWWRGLKKIEIADIFKFTANLLLAPFNLVIALINKAIRQINKINVDIPNWVPRIGGNSWGVNLKELQPIKLAKGGVAIGSSFAEIGEGRYKELIQPLGSSPEYRKMKKDIASEVAQVIQMTKDDRPLTVNLKVGERTLGEIVANSLNKLIEERGEGVLIR